MELSVWTVSNTNLQVWIGKLQMLETFPRVSMCSHAGIFWNINQCRRRVRMKRLYGNPDVYSTFFIYCTSGCTGICLLILSDAGARLKNIHVNIPRVKTGYCKGILSPDLLLKASSRLWRTQVYSDLLAICQDSCRSLADRPGFLGSFNPQIYYICVLFVMFLMGWSFLPNAPRRF